MSKYQTLIKRLDENHAVCEGIEAELNTIQPDELWVCFFEKVSKLPPAIFLKKSEADKYCQSIVTGVVRYVLPESQPKPDSLNTEQQ